VLDRYRLAAEQTGAATLLRITGDSPLIDPGFIDYIVTGLLREGGDYACLAPGALCAHEGADAFSRAALDWLAKEKGIDRKTPVRDYRLQPRFGDLPFLRTAAVFVLDAAGLSSVAQRVGDLGTIQAIDARCTAAGRQDGGDTGGHQGELGIGSRKAIHVSLLCSGDGAGSRSALACFGANE